MSARSLAIRIFLAFAGAYFLSALLRAVTATLAPAFSVEFGLRAGDLGLLAGAYFLGFSALQLPLGSALDRIGPKKVLLALMVLAVLGCAAFAMADSLGSLIVARVLMGMGLAAGLMAPLTCYRARFSDAMQLRANSWMLMTGSLGMLASTLPVQWLLPVWGWRGLFWTLAALLLVAMAVIAFVVPRDEKPAAPPPGAQPGAGYRAIVLHPAFVRNAPAGFFIYGGLIAVQTLWAGPWLTRVAGLSPQQGAAGLFVINLSMLFAFMAWGAVMPRLVQRGWRAHSIMVGGLPACLFLMAWIVLSPEPAGAWTWAAWCVSCTFVSLGQPSVGQAFPKELAGRALSAFNLVIFVGVFAVQWLVGLGIDLGRAMGLSEGAAFRVTLAVFLGCCMLAYAWLVMFRRQPPGDPRPPAAVGRAP
jgi:predicted MFS family arabinose efflux permease